MSRFIKVFLFFAAVCAIAAVPLQAATMYWINPNTVTPGDINNPDNWTGGTLPTAGDEMWVGAVNPELSTAVANITANYLNNATPISRLYVGRGARTHGTINHSDGLLALSAGVGVGREGGTGTYNMTGGSLTLGADPFIIGADAGSVGNVLLSGYASVDVSNHILYMGTHQGNGALTMTDNSYFSMLYGYIGALGGHGELHLSGSAVLASSVYTIIGDSENTTHAPPGVGNITTAAVTMSDDSQIIMNDGIFFVGLRSGSNATLDMSGNSSITMYGGAGKDFFVGSNSVNNDTGVNGEDMSDNTLSKGFVTMLGTSKVLNPSASVILGSYDVIGGGSVGVGLSAGTMTLGTPGGSDNPTVISNFTIIGDGGSGTLTINNGSFTATTGTTLDSQMAFASSTLNLHGGVLSTAFIHGGGSDTNQTVNLDGGMLQLLASDPDAIGGPSKNFKVMVKGGANIDVDLDSTSSAPAIVRVNQALRHDSSVTTDGGLTKMGVGTLVLSATSSMNGPVTVSGGTLTLTHPASVATANVTVANGATLDLGSASNLGALSRLDLKSGSTLSVALTPLKADPNGITIAPLGTMVNTSGITYAVNAQGTSLETGNYTIIQGFTGATATPAVAIATNMRAYSATAKLNATNVQINIQPIAGQFAASLDWSSSAYLSHWDLRSTTPWVGADGLFWNLDNVTFDDAVAGPYKQSKTVIVDGTVHPTSINVVASDTTFPWVFQGIGTITGVGTTLVKSGPGALVFDNPIDFTGKVTLAGGSFGTGAARGPRVLSGNVEISNASNISVAGGPLTLSGVISDTDGTGLIKNGAGTLIVGSANTYTGPTTINAGVLEVASLNDTGSTAGTPTALGAFDTDPSKLVLAGGTLRYTGSADATTDRGFTISSNYSTIATDKNLTIAGKVTGTPSVGVLTKSGKGSLTLSNVTSDEVFNGLIVDQGVMNITGTAVAKPTYGIDNGADGGDLALGQNHHAATLNLTDVNLVFSDGIARIGNGMESSGYLTVNAGANITAGNGVVGNGYFQYYVAHQNSVAVVEQTGGHMQLGYNTIIGNSSGGNESWGIWNMSSGTANVDTINAGAGLFLGYGASGYGRGILNMSGNAHMTAPKVWLGVYNNSVGILNLAEASVLTTPAVDRYDATTTGYLNFHGGTLQANADSVNFFGATSALTGTFIYHEGGTFDTNGHNVTINTPLTAPSGEGVMNIALANAGSGYTGEPVVEILGGSGTGATAKAVMSGDHIASIVITNPGTGYNFSTDVLMVKLVGGLGTGGTQALAGTISHAVNATDGGLTKTGPGTLVLNAHNTYNGPTVIKDGTLQTGTGLVAHQAVSVTPGFVGNRPYADWDGPYSLGQNFNVNTGKTLQLTQLGVFDSGSDGLNVSHLVHLTNLATMDDQVVTVEAGTTAALSNGFRFANLAAPLSLTPGTYKVWTDQLGWGADGFDDTGVSTYDSGGALTFGLTCYGFGEMPANDYVPNAAWTSFKFYDPSGSVSTDVLASTTAVLLGGSSGTKPTLDLHGNTQRVASLADVAGAVVKGVVTNSDASTPSILTLGATTGTTLYSGSISGNLSLIKEGGATQILTGPLTYNGTTEINGGTLQISTPGSVTLSTITGTGTLKVTDGTTLKATSIAVDTLSIGGLAPSAVVAVPEPSTLVLLALAGIALAIAGFRRK